VHRSDAHPEVCCCPAGTENATDDVVERLLVKRDVEGRDITVLELKDGGFTKFSGF
jgi:hypothetical protein